LNSRPLTPPCVPFGTRRFNRLSAICEDARIVQGNHNIPPVRAFRSLSTAVKPHFQQCASSPVGNCPIGMPATPVFLISLSSVPLFSASSIASRCTCGIFFAAIHSSFAKSASCPPHNSSQAIREYRPLPSPSPCVRSCLDCGGSVLSTFPLPLQGIAGGRGYKLPFHSSLD
jgi:hypothetical protein